jgi:hypothetical protein
MFNKVLIAVGLAISLFVVYLLVKMYAPSLMLDTFASTPAPAPWIQQTVVDTPPRVTVSGGPNTPSMKAMPEVVEAQPPAVADHDSFEETASSAEFTETLRHPERMFSPGLKPSDTNSAVMSGVASNDTLVSSQNLQTFVPEMAQNGGEFMKGIAANDTLGDTEYAAF